MKTCENQFNLRFKSLVLLVSLPLGLAVTSQNACFATQVQEPGFSFQLTEIQKWQNSEQYFTQIAVTVTNEFMESTTAWQVKIPADNATVIQNWHCNTSAQLDGIVASNLPYNSHLVPYGSTSFGMILAFTDYPQVNTDGIILTDPPAQTLSPPPAVIFQAQEASADKSTFDPIRLLPAPSAQVFVEDFAQRVCPICRDDMECQDTRMTPCCKQIFHTECLSYWLNSHHTCPFCVCQGIYDKLIGIKPGKDST